MVATFGDFHKFYEDVLDQISRDVPRNGFMPKFIAGYQAVLKAECGAREIGEHEFYMLAHAAPKTLLCPRAREEMKKLEGLVVECGRELLQERRVIIGML